MANEMDARSEANFVGVHPDLVKVMRLAALRSTVPFVVIHGLRTPELEAALVAQGHSQTTHSRHLPNKEGLCCAVDVAALEHGHVSWSPLLYRPIWDAVQACGIKANVPIEWGGDWKTLKDWGHFQLPWLQYP